MGAVRNLDFYLNFLHKIIKYIVCILICYHPIDSLDIFSTNWRSGWHPQVWQQRGVGVGPTRLSALDRGIGQGIGSTFQRGFVGQRHGVEKFQGRKWLVKPY